MSDKLVNPKIDKIIESLNAVRIAEASNADLKRLMEKTIEALKEAKLTDYLLQQWLDKSEWIQGEVNKAKGSDLLGGTLGWHWADAIKLLVDDLRKVTPVPVDPSVKPDEPDERNCPDCQGSGARDSGGVHSWGEPILLPCDHSALKQTKEEIMSDAKLWHAREQIEKRVCAIVKEQTRFDGKIDLDATILSLGADSLDLVEIVMEVESEYGLVIGDSESQKMTTVRHVVDEVMFLLHGIQPDDEVLTPEEAEVEYEVQCHTAYMLFVYENWDYVPLLSITNEDEPTRPEYINHDDHREWLAFKAACDMLRKV